MARRSRTQLKDYFKTGLKPTEDQFADLIDSLINKLDDKFHGLWKQGTTYKEDDVVIFEARLWRRSSIDINPADEWAKQLSDKGWIVMTALDKDGNVKIDGLAGNGVRNVVAKPDGSFTTQPLSEGDVKAVKAGAGLTGGGNTGEVTLDANVGNGLEILADKIQLGGQLAADTAIDQKTKHLNLLNGALGVNLGTPPKAKLHIGGIPKVDGIMFPDGTLQVTAGGGGGEIKASECPAFKAYPNAAIRLPNSFTKMVFNSKEFDTFGNYNPGSGRFIPHVAGMYMLTATIHATNLDNNRFIQIIIAKNGNAIINSPFNANAAGTQLSATGDSATVVAEANGTTDFFEVFVRHNNGSLTITAGNINSFFAGARVASCSSVWSVDGKQIFYEKGNVAIGAKTADARLMVAGPTGTNGLHIRAGDNNEKDYAMHVEDSDGTIQLLYTDVASNFFVSMTKEMIDKWKSLNSDILERKLEATRANRQPKADFIVNGTVWADKFSNTDGSPLSGAGTSLWSPNGNNIFYDKGNVGIGVNAPRLKLEVEGGASFNGNSLFVKNPAAPFNARSWGVVINDSDGTFNLGQANDIPSTGSLRTSSIIIQPGGPSGSIVIDREGIVKFRGGDYAEYFESTDKKAIPIGTAVVLVNGKIRPAKKGEQPFGIISTQPAMVAGEYVEWPGKYLRDEFGKIIKKKVKEYVMVPKTKKVTKQRQKVKVKKVKEVIKVTDVKKKGNKFCQVTTQKTITREVEEPVFKEVPLYNSTGKQKIGTHQIPVMEKYTTSEEVFDKAGNPVMVKSKKTIVKEVPQLNPKFNPKKKYILRQERPEWNVVGLMGQLALKKGQPVAPTWVKLKALSKEADLWLVK